MPEMIGPFTKDQMLQILTRQTEAGNALVAAGLVEDWLEKLLLTAGRELTNDNAGRIFGPMGSLGTFSAKIEIAYSFGLIEEHVRDDLRLIKSIRNNFAYPARSSTISRFNRRLMGSSTQQGGSNISSTVSRIARERCRVIRTLILAEEL
jgi:hypothetical protein